MKALASFGFDFGCLIFGPGKITRLAWVLFAGKQGLAIGSRFHGMFDSTKSVAKMTGKLLACSLAIGSPFCT
jgi:hypothetical protein